MSDELYHAKFTGEAIYHPKEGKDDDTPWTEYPVRPGWNYSDWIASRTRLLKKTSTRNAHTASYKPKD